jgi:hypothetical protein
MVGFVAETCMQAYRLAGDLTMQVLNNVTPVAHSRGLGCVTPRL